MHYFIRCRVGKLLLIHKTLAGIEYISGRSTQLSIGGADDCLLFSEALQELSTVNRGRVNFIVSRSLNELHRLIGIRQRRLLDRISDFIFACLIKGAGAFESPSHLREARARVLRKKDLIMRSKYEGGKNESPRARQFHHGRDVLNFWKHRKPTSLCLHSSLWNVWIATCAKNPSSFETISWKLSLFIIQRSEGRASYFVLTSAPNFAVH